MTDIEALLHVDSGKVPPATTAFYACDPDVGERRTHALLAAMTVGAAVACGLCGGGRLLVALFVIIAAIFALVATPTVRDPKIDGPAPKRHVMVVTARGLIVRDAWGLRSWQFDELSEIVAWRWGDRPHLVLVQRDGTRHAVDHLSFQRGERLPEVLGHHLKHVRT